MEGRQKLRVGIVGGGIAGLTTAIKAAELVCTSKIFGLLEISVLDVRYKHESANGKVLYGGSRRGEAGSRRQQVITLQNDCLQYMSKTTRTMLFSKVDEQVWPDSKNIPIAEVEDELVKRAQAPEFAGILKLETLTETSADSEADNIRLAEVLQQRFQIIIGADGANSWTRRWILRVGSDRIREVGHDEAVGISFRIPPNRFEHGLPLIQAQNVLRTVLQRRSLLNASSVMRCGFLNMQVSEEESDAVVRWDGKPCVFGRSPAGLPGTCLQEAVFKPAQDWTNGSGNEVSRRLWASIQDGLRFYGIPEDCVKTIIGIHLRVRWSEEIARQLPNGGVGVLVGDAAFQTHFWPGRGANSAIKEASLLAHCLFSISATATPFSSEISVASNEFQQYEGYVHKLRTCEHRDRSLRFACRKSGDSVVPGIDGMTGIIRRAAKYDITIGKARDVIRENARLSASRLARFYPNADGFMQTAAQNVDESLRYIGDFETKILALSGSWPSTRVNEVLPVYEIEVLLRKLKAENPDAYSNICDAEMPIVPEVVDAPMPKRARQDSPLWPQWQEFEKQWNGNNVVEISKTDVEAFGLPFLQQALSQTRIGKLRFNNCGLNFEGAMVFAEALHANANIKWLQLNNNSIGDDGATALAKVLKTSQNLQAIGLDSNGISDAGAVAFAEALKTNTKLQVIGLGENSITNVGAVAVATALKTHKNLEALSLKANKIQDGGALAIAEAIAQTGLKMVWILENPYGDVGGNALKQAQAKRIDQGNPIEFLP